MDVKTVYDADAKTFSVTCAQTIPDTPGQTDKKPVLMPIAVGLLGADGKDLELNLQGEDGGAAGETTKVLRFSTASETFVFTGVEEKPVPSILRNFSAPVRLTTDLTQEDLIFLMANDSDAFNRWEAGQTLTRSLLLGLVDDAAKGVELKMDPAIVEAMRSIIGGAGGDRVHAPHPITHTAI